MKKNVVVCVRREGDGALVSEVWNKETLGYIRDTVVIDRPSRRGPIDNDTLIRRAKALAKLLGIPYEENLEWICQAPKKLRCLCPACISGGRA